MMRVEPIMILILALGLGNCSRDHVNRRERIDPADAPSGQPSPDDPVAEIPLVQLPASGTQIRFLDALALTDIYSRVFVKGGSGRWSGCGDDPAWCQRSMLSKDEARFMGTFSLLDGVEGFRVSKDFTLNYTRNLRAMLYRECKQLVDQEWPRAANPETARQNVFIQRQQIPEVSDLDQFSRRLFGLTGTTFAIDTMAAEYRSAFAQSVSTRKDPETLKSGYVVTCMALAMDPAVFLY